MFGALEEGLRAETVDIRRRCRSCNGVRPCAADRRRIFTYKPLVAGTALFAALILLAAFGPLFWHQNTAGVNLLSNLEAPSFAHPMGTDEYGRDVFARFLIGARISLVVGFVVTGLGALLEVRWASSPAPSKGGAKEPSCGRWMPSSPFRL